MALVKPMIGLLSFGHRYVVVSGPSAPTARRQSTYTFQSTFVIGRVDKLGSLRHSGELQASTVLVPGIIRAYLPLGAIYNRRTRLRTERSVTSCRFGR
jgi:hypothetical protein